MDTIFIYHSHVRNYERLKQTELLGQQFEVYGSPQEPLFKAQDVATLLQLTNVSDMIQRVDEEERSKLNLGRQGETWMLTENGLYEVLMQSRKSIAKQFKKGVKAILKEIRTNGGYIATQEVDTPEMIMARALKVAEQTIANHQQRLQQVEAERDTLQSEVKVLSPKAEYTDKVLNATGTLTTNVIAQELGISAIRLNSELKKRGIQYKQGKQWLLTAKYRDKGLISVRTHIATNPDTGEQKTYSNTVWTEKGRKFIHSLFSTGN